MSALNITAFFNGAATAWFAIYACQLLAARERTRLQTLLGYIFVYWTFSNFKDIVQSQPGMYTAETLNVIMTMDGWSAITFACFLFELTMPGWVTARRVMLLAVPFALFSAAYALWPTAGVLTAYTAFLVLFGITILCIGYAKKGEYTRYIRANYSNIDETDISWIKQIYEIGFLSQLLWLVTSLIRLPATDTLYYISSIVLWQLTLYHSRKLRPVTPEPAAEMPAGGNAARAYSFAGVMEQVMDEEELYLNPNLSLASLATRLGTNRTYLSDYFSNAIGVTFYDYVNSLRIEKKSVPMMAAHPEYTLDYIAAQSGFNSLSTFRRAFHKHTGVTPGKWRG